MFPINLNRQPWPRLSNSHSPKSFARKNQLFIPIILFCTFVIAYMAIDKDGFFQFDQKISEIPIKQYEHNLILIADCGSSHTDIFLIAFISHKDHDDLLLPTPMRQFEQRVPKSVSASIGSDDSVALASQQILEIFTPLLSQVTSFLESDQSMSSVAQKDLWSTIPLYIHYTAGVRQLSSQHQTTILTAVDSVFLSGDSNQWFPFLFETGFSAVISGTSEGIFAWFAANLENDSVGRPAYDTFGIVEMGGSSTQIAVATTVPSLYTYDIPFQSYWIYTVLSRSIPRFGINDMRQFQFETLVNQYWQLNRDTIDTSVPLTITNPCLLPDYRTNVTQSTTIEGVSYVFIGSGDAAECSAFLAANIAQSDLNICLDQSNSDSNPMTTTRRRSLLGCNITNLRVYVPIGTFYSVLTGIKGVNITTLLEFKTHCDQLCSVPLSNIGHLLSDDMQPYLEQWCIECQLTYIELTRFGFDDSYDCFYFSKNLKPNWPIGAAYFHRNNLPFPNPYIINDS